MPLLLPRDATPLIAHRHHRVRPITPARALGIARRDLAIGPLSRVDHWQLDAGALMPWHEHRNDDVLTYVGDGVLQHRDTAGRRELLDREHAMLLRSGSGYMHQLSATDGAVSMLQIFARPTPTEQRPRVMTAQLPPPRPAEWRVIAGPPSAHAPLSFQNALWMFDTALSPAREIAPPSIRDLVTWLYVFAGTVRMGELLLEAGDSVLESDESLPTVRAVGHARIVVFVADPAALVSLRGQVTGLGIGR